jgi:hypothetical protein
MRHFLQQHPRLAMWAALAVGMVLILVWAAQDQGFSTGQWAALVGATVLLAGLCVWILGWEDEEEDAA